MILNEQVNLQKKKKVNPKALSHWDSTNVTLFLQFAKKRFKTQQQQADPSGSALEEKRITIVMLETYLKFDPRAF